MHNTAVVAVPTQFTEALQQLKRQIHWLLALLPLALFLFFLRLLPPVAAGHTFAWKMAWVPSLDVNVALTVDGLGLFMALIVSGIGALVVVYGGAYLHGEAEIGRFFVFILAFMAAMLLLVLSDNIYLLFIAWELTSLTSFFLIGFHHEEEKAQKAALQALLVTGSGGLAMLAGLILLQSAGGSADLSTLLQRGEAIRGSALYLPILLLILLGAFSKSAQFPFHFWLPNAMVGPTPVSAYLHSATMVTAGVYLLARLQPALGGTVYWTGVLVAVGGITAVLGAWLSWQKTDLKAILAYSTISALGLMMLLLGLGGEAAFTAVILFLLVHALYKAALFMGVGIIDHATGTRDVTELGGLRGALPATFAGMLLAAASMAGLPPLLGFASKELMYEAALHHGPAAWRLTAVFYLSNVFMVAAAGVVAIRPFFGPANPPTIRHKPPLSLWLGPVLLGAASLLLGLAAGSPFLAAFILPAASSIAGTAVHVETGLWHGLTPMLALSGATLTGGAFWYLIHAQIRPWLQRLDGVSTAVGPARWYDASLDALLRLADGVTRLVQNGYLRYYVLAILGTFLLLVGTTFLARGGGFRLPDLTRPLFHELVIGGVILAAITAVVRLDSRLAVIAALGVIGYGIAVLYILFGAPDLAMTQFAIETLTVILFVLVLYRLPAFEKFSKRRTRARDGLIAGLSGLLMAGLVLAVKTVPHQTTLTDYFAAHTYTLAGGHNIVNVILVDFRGFDTMVEITVLSVAAIGVYALLKSRPQQRPHEAPLAPSLPPVAPPPRSLILTTATRYLLPLLLLFSLFILLRGHHHPGGGFIGGLVASAALALYGFAYGIPTARRILRVEPLKLIGVGLLLAAVSGLIGPLAEKKAFMTAVWGHTSYPALGKVGTPLLFDLGVYLTVIGVTLLIILTLAEEEVA